MYSHRPNSPGILQTDPEQIATVAISSEIFQT